MNELQVFFNEEFGNIRTVTRDGEPWFVGKDVAETLGYSNPRKALLDHVEAEDKDGVTSRDAIGREQNTTIINESGLYSLIFSSKLPNAKAFKHWITSEVIPSIRKTGTYMTDNAIDRVLADPESFIKLLTAYKDERAARRQLETKVEADAPKVLFADAVAASTTTVLVRDLAKILRQNGVKIGQNCLFDWLRENNYLIKRGESKNMPTQTAMEKKLFRIKERTFIGPDGSNHISRTVMVTGKGQQYFVNLFLGKAHDD